MALSYFGQPISPNKQYLGTLQKERWLPSILQEELQVWLKLDMFSSDGSHIEKFMRKHYLN